MEKQQMIASSKHTALSLLGFHGFLAFVLVDAPSAAA